jgi:hypothetical protein
MEGSAAGPRRAAADDVAGEVPDHGYSTHAAEI